MIIPDCMPEPNESVLWLILYNNQLMDTQPQQPHFMPPQLTLDELPQAKRGYTAKIGDYEGRAVYMLVADADMKFPARWQWLPLRQCLLRTNELLFSLGARACQIQHFLSTHKFCGRCGSALAQSRDELAVVCGACKTTDYPRISPCIIVGIYKDKQILLAQGTRHPQGLYSVLAGFVESGESLEQTLKREVKEEVGIEVTDIEYVMSQAWPFPHSLMAGFVARYAGGEITPDPTEIVTADWFHFDALPQTPPQGTIAAKLINVVAQKVGL